MTQAKNSAQRGTSIAPSRARGSVAQPVPAAGEVEREPDTLIRATSSALSSRFLAQLASHTDGIGWVQVLESWRRHGVLARLERAPIQGMALGALAAETGANLGYLAVVCRVLAVQGWLSLTPAPEARQRHAALTPAGRELCGLLESGTQSSLIRAFTPVARHMAEYLEGSWSAPPQAPALEQLARWSRRGWDLPRGEAGATSTRLAAAFDGNLLGPIAAALALSESASLDWARQPERRAYLGTAGPREVEPANARQHAAFEVLAHAGWGSWQGERLLLSDYGAYALRRGAAYGVPVSYLPLFEHIDELCFGDAEAFWQRGPGEPERHVDRWLNVRASGASHGRYFAAADEIIGRAFDLPWPEQPLGFCDMGSGDGAWLEHIWRLIETRTERGRLMRAHPHDPRYRPLLVGADYNEAARAATRARLLEAGIPHLVIFGDVNDPAGLQAELGRRGIDSRQLLHGSSFLVHNRPYTGVRDARAAALRAASSGDGAYAWRGRALHASELQQNLVELLGGWRGIVGQHGMLVIELHDPELAVPEKTLSNYMLTHGLSDQLTVGVSAFLGAAAEARLMIDPKQQRFFPEPLASATISVSHLLPG